MSHEPRDFWSWQSKTLSTSTRSCPRIAGASRYATVRMGPASFFEEPNRCRIQEAKPAQCHGFPNQWRFDGFEKECPAIKLSMRLAPNREPHEESTCGNE